MTFRLLQLNSYPIYEQLLLEEALLREDSGNWCLINEGITSPAIVMGISGKKEELIHCEKAAENHIPLIKRFSGGGTVFVDHNTLFVTFICEKSFHDFPSYPEPIMRWTESIYKQVFNHPQFALRENDFVIHEKKFGGNAQYIKKQRWLHHTSFLWDYDPLNMDYLLFPKKTPTYRNQRSHSDFLCTLSEYFEDRTQIIEKIIQTLETRYGIEKENLENVLSRLSGNERISTTLLT